MKSQDGQHQTQDGIPDSNEVDYIVNEYKPGEEIISQNFDIKKLFHLKKSNKLYAAIKSANGAILARNLETRKGKRVNPRDIVWLEHYGIPTNAGGKIKLMEVFDSLSVRFNFEEADLEATGVPLADAMTLMCPDHDADQFRDYHAAKIIKWYNILITAYRKSVIKSENEE